MYSDLPSIYFEAIDRYNSSDRGRYRNFFLWQIAMICPYGNNCRGVFISAVLP